MSDQQIWNWKAAAGLSLSVWDETVESEDNWVISVSGPAHWPWSAGPATPGSTGHNLPEPVTMSQIKISVLEEILGNN